MIMLTDMFDRAHSDQMIVFKSDTCITKMKGVGGYSCAVGTIVVGKGDKQSWTCKIDNGFLSVLVGIIDDETAMTEPHIGDHTVSRQGGYGLGLNSFERYHGEERIYTFDYAKQFENFMSTDALFVITMTLDMTQSKGDGGNFSYEFRMKPKDDIQDIKTDGIYTTVGWDKIDINRKYRIAFSINRGNAGEDAAIKFLSNS